MTACKECRDRGQTWEGGAPKCAFDTGIFTRSNWNCALANAIRDIADENNPVWQEDQYYATIPLIDCFWAFNEYHQAKYDALWVSWYKRRGATDAMYLLDSHWSPQVCTANMARAIIKGKANPQMP